MGDLSFLTAAYPDERQRAHAGRWLGLLAVYSPDDKPLTWWRATAMVGRQAFIAREATCAVLIAAMFIPGFAIVLVSDEAHLVLSGLALIAMWGTWTWSVRSRRESWAHTDDRPYRAARADSLRRGLAWAPAGAVVGLISAPAGIGVWIVLVAAAYSAGIAALAAARTGNYPLALSAEIILAAGWGERPALAVLLEDAAERGVLRAARDGYQFHEELGYQLARHGRAELAAHSAVITARLDSPLSRQVPLARLSRRGAARGGWDAVAGSAIAAALVGGAILRFYGNLSHYWWALIFLAAGVALVTGVGAYLVLRLAAKLTRLALGYVPGWARSVRLLIGAIAVGCGVALVAGEGPALAAILAFCLPAALVAGCGGWACSLARRWPRPAPDVIAVITITACLLVLVRRSLLTAGPASGLLFPVATWGAFRIWRAMTRSHRLVVAAAANIVGSLLFGGLLVLLLVWLANVLRFTAAVVAALRWWLEQIGSFADLPWWAWTGLYAVLAGTGLVIVGRPDLLRLRRAWRRFVPATAWSQQMLTCLHVGLLAIVLIGLAAPPSAGQVVRRHLRAAYLVALQREFDDAAELSAYRTISQQFTPGPPRRTLTALVIKVHDVAGPGGIGTEDDLARRLGAEQAEILASGTAPTAPAAAPGGADLAEQADAVENLDDADDATGSLVEQAADVAAKLVASTISIPSVTDNEVFQVVREYLSGLVEESRIMDVFSAWIEHLPGAKRPAPADVLITPDPARLEAVANATLTQEMVAQGLGDPATDPDAPSAAWQLAQYEQPLDAAVDVTNQTLYLEDPSSDTCDQCAAPRIPVAVVADLGTWIGDLSTPPKDESHDENPGEPDVHDEP
jgi:hypothetical protein